MRRHDPSAVRHAVLDDFAYVIDLHKKTRRKEGTDAEAPEWFLNLSVAVVKMLDWFVRHHPDSAQWYIGEIMREAHNRWNIPAQATGKALRRSLAMDGELDKDAALKEYFARVVPWEQTP
ncbi:hypothetical protein [Streptomyces sp. UNOB3_S3]|uniref:hypothetical protein n=1 Tax=Streptomyces sp. UNOB3_S3 TaxID=2871682 RepID=UPI001E290064|nr:hypothetical protein [Streptomyces sp. UNOB3_S3]MCC3774235.1 hypothetical protein [Streptomyces sp. UNOB3_S3]